VHPLQRHRQARRRGAPRPVEGSGVHTSLTPPAAPIPTPRPPGPGGFADRRSQTMNNEDAAAIAEDEAVNGMDG